MLNEIDFAANKKISGCNYWMVVSAVQPATQQPRGLSKPCVVLGDGRLWFFDENTRLSLYSHTRQQSAFDFVIHDFSRVFGAQKISTVTRVKLFYGPRSWIGGRRTYARLKKHFKEISTSLAARRVSPLDNDHVCECRCKFSHAAQSSQRRSNLPACRNLA